jgi:ubiquinone/menaquinone biosynthesis C-methylase UbiE
MLFDTERAKYFDQLARRWDTMVSLPAESLVRRVVSAASLRSGCRILDVGSGTGNLLKYLLQAEPAQLVACDISQQMLNVISAKYPGETRLTLLCADARELPLDRDSFDAVICNGVYPHFSSKQAALRELHRVLAPGGRLVISHFGGWAHVNGIHSSAPDPLIRRDLLEPATDVAALLGQTGFTVTACADDADLFLVAGVKAS